GAGASIIIGAHAHMLQGSGWLGRTFVAYGLGNFLWWEHSYSTATGVLELTIHPHAPLTARFIPAVVSGTGQPIPGRGAAARRAAAHYATLSDPEPCMARLADAASRNRSSQLRVPAVRGGRRPPDGGAHRLPAAVLRPDRRCGRRDGPRPRRRGPPG